MTLGLGFGIVLAGSTASTFAQSYGDSAKQVNDLINDLKPHTHYSGGGLPEGGRHTRKVIVISHNGTRHVYFVDYDSTASLSVEFHTGSNDLTARSRKLLKVLAAALSSHDLSYFSYIIAGHTDSRGSRAYNQKLSERRALSVARYLSDYLGIDRGRLVPVGFGEDQLANPDAPRSGVNRRVEVGLIVRAPADYGREADGDHSGNDDDYRNDDDYQPAEGAVKKKKSTPSGGDGDTNSLITN